MIHSPHYFYWIFLFEKGWEFFPLFTDPPTIFLILTCCAQVLKSFLPTFLRPFFFFADSNFFSAAFLRRFFCEISAPKLFLNLHFFKIGKMKRKFFNILKLQKYRTKTEWWFLPNPRLWKIGNFQSWTYLRFFKNQTKFKTTRQITLHTMQK